MSRIRKTPPLEAQVAQLIASLDGSSNGIVVAVSGGPDSVALACAACNAGVPMVIAHLNHQLRGDESDGDAAFVENLTHQLSSKGTVSYRAEQINVRERAEAAGENLEAVARRIRYRWLAEVARHERIRWVATGHTADDQAETVLHRIIRGTGLKGLRGIAERRRLADDVELVRPLLRTTRTEVLAYLETLHQGFREDSSNRDPRFTRNRIRYELLPLLAERFNPSIAQALARLADEVNSVYQRRVEAASAVLREAERPRAGKTIVLHKPRLTQEPRALVREVLRLIWEREGWHIGRMDRDAWDRVAGLVFGDSVSVDLPNGVRAVAKEHVIQLHPTS